MSALLLLAGCSDDGDDATPSAGAPGTTTSTTAAPTTTTTLLLDALPIDPDLSDEEQVEASYLHHWEVVLRAFETGDDALLDTVLTGELLQVRHDQLAHLTAQEQHTEGTVAHDVTVDMMGPDQARVVDRETSSLRTLDADGAVVSDDAGELTTNEYTLVRVDDAWLVASSLQR